MVAPCPLTVGSLVRFELITGVHNLIEADGVPPNEVYPEFFVDEDGWVYPVSTVVAFHRVTAE